MVLDNKLILVRQTAESISGPKWAIARDLTIYDANAKSVSGPVSADRGPPMGQSLLRFHVGVLLQLLSFF